MTHNTDLCGYMLGNETRTINRREKKGVHMPDKKKATTTEETNTPAEETKAEEEKVEEATTET